MSQLTMVLARGVSKRGQVTLFVVIAIIIVVGIALFFILKDKYSNIDYLDKEVQPVYESFISCLEGTLDEGIQILGYQGGYIGLPEFVPGSIYRPTSSQLDLFGQPVAYWSYISGNNLASEQVPTKESMEDELSNYIEERLEMCDLSEYKSQGIFTYIGDGNAVVDINSERVSLKITNPLNIYTESETYTLESHEITVDSKLGKFYDLAIKTYELERKTYFLENYALDALWTSSPVIGVDITCEPKVFVDEIIQENLSNALSTNIAYLKLKGNYYTLNSDLNKYFVVDLGNSVDEEVNFMYSTSWPTKIEITGDHIVTPVGIQQGLEILGFCYVPYHLVYDIDFPVMIQFMDDDFIFQFPVVVSIKDNEILNLSKSTGGVSLNDEVCEIKNNELKVYTYDYELNPIETRLQYECMNSLCEIGSTKSDGVDSYFEGAVPGCVNGKVIASADGYLSTTYTVEDPSTSVVNLLLEKKYSLMLDTGSQDRSTIYFNGEDYATTVSCPQQKTVDLVEGRYNVSMITYSSTTITLSQVQNEVCVDVPINTVGELFDITEKQCYPIENPQTEIDLAVIGGGSLSNIYITESELKRAATIKILGEEFEKPSSIEDLQENYLLLESAKLDMEVL